TSSQYKIKIKRLFYWIFPYMYYMACDKVICPDEKRITDYKRYFSVSRPAFIFSKQPRNQYAIKHQKQKKILISPTYRKWDNLFINNYLSSLCSKNLEQCLISKGYTLILRPHPLDVPFIHQDTLPNYVQLDTSVDLYESITSYALVITDYSSIYYDCMELAIPCYIFAPDLALYQEKVGLGAIYFTEIQNKLISKIEDIID
ncbi:MAG: CDP-glycerol glycerophosphotransferase family protein, partial [Candidatus Schmidhempelia sp.]|nr:CDP-glycerol glycerophosphotransferase family protein [Candidatus Schmidhempelia sp.]